MWAIVDAKMATMRELKTEWTLDEYAECWEYLHAKRAAEAKAQREANAKASR